MNFSVLTQRYDTLPPFCEKEILRYAGCKKEDPAVLALMHSAMEEAAGVLTYRVCHCRLSVTLRENVCDFGFFSLESRDLSQYLSSCEWTSVFAATVGIAPDRLVAKYSRISPSRAVLLQALGAERIETLCDSFCRELKEETGYTAEKWTPYPSFYASPGYLDEKLFLFLAEDLIPGESALEDGENLSPLSVSLEKALEMIDAGEIEDGKTVGAILRYALNTPFGKK